jgi:hypothetical protein
MILKMEASLPLFCANGPGCGGEIALQICHTA